jgi:predicted DsbA family dithiol-disulfide isomerase
MIPLEIFSDLVCPWCFIGKRRLQRALPVADQPVSITWRAFQLNPDMPPEGVSAEAFFLEKFGSWERTRAIWERVTAAGREDGIHFAFDKMQRAPSSELAHRAVAQVATTHDPAPFVDALFSAHFERGEDIGDQRVVLEQLAVAKLDIDPQELASALERGAGQAEVLRDQRRAASLGIQGVPFFVAGNRYAVSGAQREDVLVSLLQQAATAA